MSVFIPVFPTAGFFELPSSNRSLAKFWLALQRGVEVCEGVQLGAGGPAGGDVDRAAAL